MVKFVGDSAVERAAGNFAVGIVFVRDAAEIFFVNDERQCDGFTAVGIVAVRNVSEPVLGSVILKVQINFGNGRAAVGEVHAGGFFIELQGFLEPPLVKTGDYDVLIFFFKAADVAGIYRADNFLG